MATQNPVENEGTYQLPEAQIDRFHDESVCETIPPKNMNLKSCERISNMGFSYEVNPVLTKEDIFFYSRRS
jgi:MoxR-like ATPase